MASTIFRLDVVSVQPEILRRNYKQELKLIALFYNLKQKFKHYNNLKKLTAAKACKQSKLFCNFVSKLTEYSLKTFIIIQNLMLDH
jgi:predicted ABC-type ATPase